MLNFWERELCYVKFFPVIMRQRSYKSSIFDNGDMVEICLGAMPRLNFSVILFFEDSLGWDWDF